MATRLCAYVLLVAATACGGSTPAGPSTATVAGTWSGTMAFTISTGPVSQGLAMTLTQSGAAVSGTWQTTGGTVPKTGNVAGTTTATSFSGPWTINISNPGAGTACNGTLSVSGPAGGNTLTWTSPGVGGNCTNDPPTNITFSAVRQ